MLALTPDGCAGPTDYLRTRYVVYLAIHHSGQLTLSHRVLSQVPVIKNQLATFQLHEAPRGKLHMLRGTEVSCSVFSLPRSLPPQCFSQPSCSC